MKKKRKQLIEAEVIEGLKQNDKSTFEDVFHAFFGPVCYFCDDIVHDIEEAKDITISTFTDMWGEREKFTKLSGIVGFLYTCAKNRCYNHLKKQKREGKRNKFFQERLGESTDSIEADIVKGEIMKELAKAGESLPHRYKKIYNFIMKGKTITEIALLTNQTQNTVSRQKIRMMELLYKGMQTLDSRTRIL